MDRESVVEMLSAGVLYGAMVGLALVACALPIIGLVLLLQVLGVQ